MKQSEITVRVDLHRGTASDDGLDLRPVSTTTSASTPTTAPDRARRRARARVGTPQRE